MREIRLGLEAKVDVSVYAKTKFDDYQMSEIREGLVANLDVSLYANPKYSSEEMRKKRRSLYEESPDFDPYYSYDYDWFF